MGATWHALVARSVAGRRAQGGGSANQPTGSQTARHGAQGRERVAGSQTSPSERPTLDFLAGRRRPSAYSRDLQSTGAGRGWPGAEKSLVSCTYLGGQRRWSGQVVTLAAPAFATVVRGRTLDANTSSNHYARHGAPH